MNSWQENEVKELLKIRASEPIRQQITGTVKDSAVYHRVVKLLAERGSYRSQMQVISKLKALRKQYIKYHEQKMRDESVNWPFYALCHRAFGSGKPVKRARSPSAPLQQSSPPPPPPVSDEHHEVVVDLWDEVDDGEIDKQLGPMEAEDEYEQNSPPEQLRPNNTMHNFPSRKRKTTVMEQVSTLVSATVSQLREMDAAMQAQEDARLQRLIDHEKEMQNNLMCQLMAMHERISQDNHERHVELMDRILSRFPSSSGPSGP